jgi:hypothetical protein
MIYCFNCEYLVEFTIKNFIADRDPINYSIIDSYNRIVF